MQFGLSFCIILACFVFWGQDSFSQNVFVRVRTQKNLESKPVLPEGNMKIKNVIRRKENGLFDVITIVPFNDYLAGVVSKEMPLSWPKEALKAQAVVARSYVLARMQERQNKPFHVESDQMDQVFNLTNSKKAYQAVLETENIFLTDGNQRILKAFYHSDCGGQTVPANLVWFGAIDSGTAVDSWCESKEKNKWQYLIPRSEVATEDFLKFKKYRKKIIEAAGISIQKLREKFGFDQIRNAPDQIEITGEDIIISGQGYGHGAGLCQHGTFEQAQLGRSFLDIIKHYYPKAIISDSKVRLANLKNSYASDLIFN